MPYCFAFLSNDIDHVRSQEHSGFRGVWWNVDEHGIELLGDNKMRRDFRNRRNSERVLRRHRRNHGHSVNLKPGERFEIGLNAGAAAGSEPAMVRAILTEDTEHQTPAPGFAGHSGRESS